MFVLMDVHECLLGANGVEASCGGGQVGNWLINLLRVVIYKFQEGPIMVLIVSA